MPERTRVPVQPSPAAPRWRQPVLRWRPRAPRRSPRGADACRSRCTSGCRWRSSRRDLASPAWRSRRRALGRTVTFQSVAMDFGPVGPDICPNLPTGELLVTAIGVFPGNVNGAGDYWITETLTGPAVITDGTSTLFAGHLEAWFGREDNGPIGLLTH